MRTAPANEKVMGSTNPSDWALALPVRDNCLTATLKANSDWKE
jgi:hypothetical protein